MEITEEIIRKCVEAFRLQQSKKNIYQRYYEGKHDILNEYTFNKERANMKIVVNWFKKFLNDELAYSLNNPVNYIDKKDNAQVIDAIDTEFSSWEKVHNQNLMLQAGIFGHAYELRYLKDGEFKATVLTPLNAYVLEGNDADKTALLGMHFYKENQFSDTEMMDVYLPNKVVQHYKMNGGSIELIGKSSHAFERVPMSIVSYNLERKSLLDSIKSLNDSYNVTVSNMVNELSDFRMALLKLIGTRFDNDEDIGKVMEKGILQLQQGTEIDYLTKNLPDAFVKSVLTEIKENLYKQASHIDTNEKMQSNTSGSALRGRLITLENKCTTIHNMLEQCIKSRLKDYFYIQHVRSIGDYDYRNIKMKFTMNVPHDIGMLADTASKLKDIMSLQTLYSLFPFVENPSLEYKKFMDERDNMMSGEVDLNNVE